jgi:hypothetical protein
VLVELIQEFMETLFDFQTTTVHADPTWSDPDDRFFASEDGRVAPLSAEECLFVVKSSGAPHVMTTQVLRALDLCREFRRLDEHVARIEAEIPELHGKRSDIRRVLDGLIRREVMVSDADFLARLHRSPARMLPPMREVYIRGCDRPERLAYLLASLVDYERRHRAGRRYVLIDDSSIAAHADAQRGQLRDFAQTTGCEVRYFGKTESLTLVERIARAQPHAREAARALLLRDAHPQAQRFGGGRSRNRVLLLSAGTRPALLDDDLRLPLRQPDFAATGFDPDPDAPAHTRFFAGMDEALAQGVEVDEDPFELHLEVCGQTLAACTEGRYALRRETLLGLNLGRLERLKGGARIVTTHHGSYGSSRTESTLWLYHTLDPAGREDFWRDRENYLRNTQAHHILYAANRARAVEVPGFTPFTLDNTTLLPCTNPVGRAEDSLAAALTHYCVPNALALELPVAIGHVQESLRPRFSHTRGASVPRVNDFLRDFVKQQFDTGKSADPGQRLGLLAHAMRDLAGASARDRVEHLREYRRFVHADIVQRLQRELETTAAAPIYWQADVRAITQAHAKELLAASAPRLAEWAQDIDAAGCAQALAGELNAMADACEHWPALWQHAAEQGERLLSAP